MSLLYEEAYCGWRCVQEEDPSFCVANKDAALSHLKNAMKKHSTKAIGKAPVCSQPNYFPVIIISHFASILLSLIFCIFGEGCEFFLIRECQHFFGLNTMQLQIFTLYLLSLTNL